MGKVIFQAQIKQFNRKALVSGDTQIRLILECVDETDKQSEVMKDLSEIKLGQELVEVSIEKIRE